MKYIVSTVVAIVLCIVVEKTTIPPYFFIAVLLSLISCDMEQIKEQIKEMKEKK
jgi:hypothetical protein